MGYKDIDKTLPKMMEYVVELVGGKHKEQKGIIHTGSYVVMRKLQRYIKEKDKKLFKRMLFQTQGSFQEKSRIIALHETSSEPTVLCGPGFMEGLDLKNELARFNILMKMPYMSLADPLIKRKAEEFPEWYSLQTALALIQAIGRVVRSKDDWAVTYILDSLFRWFYHKNKHIFPKHIRKQLKWQSDYGLKDEVV